MALSSLIRQSAIPLPSSWPSAVFWSDAFSIPGPGQFGTSGQVLPNARNFPIFNENVSLAKTFSLSHENRREFDVRLEAFNPMNRVRFSSPNTNLSSTSFGLVTGQANAPRNLQLAMKLIW